jgi:hypothetical protein
MMIIGFVRRASDPWHVKDMEIWCIIIILFGFRIDSSIAWNDECGLCPWMSLR